MILYHGSNIDIIHIDLSQSKTGKDFGCGFYLSADKEQARELAERKTEPDIKDKVAYIIAVISEFAAAHSLTPSQAYRLMNRRNRTRIPAHNYDIVIGPIADDAVGFQIRRFTSGLIDMDMFVEELKYMKGITIQYFFGTEKAIRYLKKLETL